MNQTRESDQGIRSHLANQTQREAWYSFHHLLRWKREQYPDMRIASCNWEHIARIAVTEHGTFWEYAIETPHGHYYEI